LTFEYLNVGLFEKHLQQPLRRHACGSSYLASHHRASIWVFVTEHAVILRQIIVVHLCAWRRLMAATAYVVAPSRVFLAIVFGIVIYHPQDLTAVNTIWKNKQNKY
jgi:hypothetical protein